MLKEQPIKYGQLKKSIPNICNKILSQELKKLEMDNLIERIPYTTIPPKVEYLPTNRGKSLENILYELCL
ncbi:winged helix-turn-helix transcriptional regulator [Clostridium sp. MT-14]|uniref:winged helix-turn-helix transcriptional regulator n=1 Tax=Clostridium sp. MT-14 TaxID=3348360 RepID=UPI0035F40ADE